MRVSIRISLLLLGAVAAGCRNAPPPSAMPPVPAAATDFSGDAAYAYLRALAAIGPRAAGTPGNAEARAYIRKRAGEPRPRGDRAPLRRAAGAGWGCSRSW